MWTMMSALKKIGNLGIIVGVILLCYGGLAIVNHGAPRQPLWLEAQ